MNWDRLLYFATIAAALGIGAYIRFPASVNLPLRLHPLGASGRNPFGRVLLFDKTVQSRYLLSQV